MSVLLLLIAALVVIVLTEIAKLYVAKVRPEAIAAIFSVLAVVIQSVQRGQPPDVPALVNGLYLYMIASLGYDKVVGPISQARRTPLRR